MSHRKRCKPLQISYGGMEFKIGTLKANGRIDISYKSNDMKTAFTREFVPVCAPPDFVIKTLEPEGDISTIDASIVLQIGEYLPENVIQWTLQEKLPRYFLEALFKEHPDERTPAIHFGLLGEYALIRLHKNSPLALSTMLDEQDTLCKMVQLWGDRPIATITPDNVGIDLTEKMSTTLATKCVRLLRKIYPASILGSNSNDTVDPFVWTNYKQIGRKSQYSPKRRVRTNLLNTPPSPGKIRNAIEQCINAINSNNEAERHLAALIMLTEGIDIEEACALRADSLVPLPSFHNEWSLNIDRIVVSLRNDDKADFVRESRHKIDDMLPPERRKLGVSRILVSCWNTYVASHPNFKYSQLLLSNPENKSRVLSPNKFRKWLQKTYGNIVSDTTLTIGGTNVSTSFNVEDAFLAASKFLLTDLGGYSSEELRYHFGLKPMEMDGKHYAGFDAPCELVTQAKMQDRALSFLLGGSYIPSITSSKFHQVHGQANRISRIHVEIDVEKMLATIDNEHDLMFRLKALGFSQKITFVEKEEQ